MADGNGWDLLAPIPFREVFVMLALFLPQLAFVEEASARQDLWSSPTVRKYSLLVDITPTAAGLQGMHEDRIAFPSWSQMAGLARERRVLLGPSAPACFRDPITKEKGRGVTE